MCLTIKVNTEIHYYFEKVGILPIIWTINKNCSTHFIPLGLDVVLLCEGIILTPRGRLLEVSVIEMPLTVGDMTSTTIPLLLCNKIGSLLC